MNNIYYSTHENILCFADDTTVYLSDNNPSHFFTRANKCLNEIFNWFRVNKLSLNAK